jgi:dephospho-CoA kinase
MLRVGLTGELGSGKSTVAAMLAARGAIVLSSDDIARELMQPGQPVFAAILEHFGSTVLTPDHTLDRRKLAALAFHPTHPRVDELTAIIHPAVIAEQAARLATLPADAIAVIESALILTTPFGTANRFDRLIVVTAPEEAKVARFIARTAPGRTLSPKEHSALDQDARRRLALQHAPPPPGCFIIRNDGDVAHLNAQVDNLWKSLSVQLRATSGPAQS